MSDTDTEDVPVTPTEKRGRGAPKGKRTPTPAQLETLAKARHRAAEIRKLRTIVELEDAIAEKKASMPELTRFEPDIKLPPNQVKPIPTEKNWPGYPKEAPPPDLPNVCESIVTPDEIKNETIKNEIAKKKKKTRIIIEQSSSDEDIFENTDDVIFVKRRGRKDVPKKCDIAPEVNANANVNANSNSNANGNVNVTPYTVQPAKSKFTSISTSNFFDKRFY
jgi:hypothetical protein